MTLEGSRGLWKLGCVVEQTQQAGGGDFREIAAEGFARMEAIHNKLALKPDAQFSPLERDGMVFVIWQKLQSFADDGKES